MNLVQIYTFLWELSIIYYTFLWELLVEYHIFLGELTHNIEENHLNNDM